MRTAICSVIIVREYANGDLDLLCNEQGAYQSIAATAIFLYHRGHQVRSVTMPEAAHREIIGEPRTYVQTSTGGIQISAWVAECDLRAWQNAVQRGVRKLNLPVGQIDCSKSEGPITLVCDKYFDGRHEETISCRLVNP